MASKLNKFLITFLFFSIILNSPVTTTSQIECPYPCYPPPTGPGKLPPVTPSPPSQTASYSPPALYFNPPPSGFLPNYPPPPYYVNGAAVPPPPEPIVPWFPYYYRKPPHGSSDDFSSSSAPRGWTAVICTIHLLVFLILLSH